MNHHDIDEYISTLKQGEILSENAMKRLCASVSELLMEESNVQPIRSPVTIVGDLHGQFYDLLHLLSSSVGNEPPHTSYIFLGDFVDRGHHSIETLTLLLLLKLKYPGHVTLLRGNHESRQITQVYGFYDECLRKYGNASVWRYCTTAFDTFNLAAIIDSEVLCVHGGLSPDVRTIDQIRAIDRQIEIPHEGAFCDLVWSDPEDFSDSNNNGGIGSSAPWQISPRGAGFLFGEQVTNEFNQVNGLSLIARAHQLVMEGKKYHFSNRNLVTVWSAPNYCYRCGNVAAILTIGEQSENGNGGGTFNGNDSNNNNYNNNRSDNSDDDNNNTIENGDDDSEMNHHPTTTTTMRNKNSAIKQSFKFFHETEYSQHGPKGIERAQYFL